MKKVLVPLADGFEEIEAVSIIDVLRRAEIEVTIVSISHEHFVKGSHQIGIMADKIFSEMDATGFDMIILPGGMPGSKNLNQHEGLKKLIVNFHDRGKLLGAICAAPMIFGQLGILADKRATCYPGFEKYLEGAITTDNKTEISGSVLTGKGAGTAIDFALKAVELLKGIDIAKNLSEKLIAGN